MIVEQDISQAEPDETGAVVVPAEKGPTRGWAIVETIDWTAIREQADKLKAKALGISPEFLSAGETIVASPRHLALMNDVNERLTESLRAVRCGYLEPRAVRGGAYLRHNGQKFRSLRLARMWWKTNMRDNPDFDPEPFMLKGQLGTMYGETIHYSVTPGIIPHILGVNLITDTYRKPNDE